MAEIFIMIPERIAKNSDLSGNEKLLYGKLKALSNNEKRLCWAGNEYLAEYFSTDVRTISRWLKVLKEKKLICIHKEYKAGRVKKRNIIVY
jgi:DNA-binding transcriptional ArsR family regulator